MKFIILALILLSSVSCSQAKVEPAISNDAPTDYSKYIIKSREEYFACYDKYIHASGEKKASLEDREKFLLYCGTSRPKPTQEELSWLKTRTLKRMAFVKGGEFIMNNFGQFDNRTPDQVVGYINLPPYDWHVTAPEKYPLKGKKVMTIRSITIDDNFSYSSYPYFYATLDDYSMSQYMIEEQEYNLYAASLSLPMIHSQGKRRNLLAFKQAKDMPAMVSWQQANDYCTWLGDLIDKPMQLPTEAQWEYAAQNRGEFRIFPTDNGLFEDGKNAMMLRGGRLVPDERPMGNYEENHEGLYDRDLRVIALFKKMPPNPLGFYNMMNTMEWVQDWYNPDFYQEGAHYKNPTGASVPYIETGPNTLGAQRMMKGNPEQSTLGREQAPVTGEYMINVYGGFRCVAKGKLKT